MRLVEELPYKHRHRRRGQGRARTPKNSGKNYFSGNYYVKFMHFSGKNHVKFRNFANFAGKYTGLACTFYPVGKTCWVKLGKTA